MIDSAKRQFISYHNLQQKQCEDHRHQYQNHPASLVIIDDFFQRELASQCADFLQFQAAYKDVYGLYSKDQDAYSKQAWLDASPNERFFFYQMLDHSDGNAMLGRSGMSFLKLRRFLGSGDFKSYLQTIIGEAVGPVTSIKVHRMQSSHFLNRHDDRSDNRFIAFILYLSNTWKPDFGGHLQLIDKQKQKHDIAPNFNRLLIFDVSNHDYHYISDIVGSNLDSSANRLSINGWFLHPE